MIIPMLATYDDASCPAATSAAELAQLSDESKATGGTIAWSAPCAVNYRNCYADIGSVPWLPAAELLDFSSDSKSQRDCSLYEKPTLVSTGLPPTYTW